MAPPRMQLSLAADGEMLSLDPHTSIRCCFLELVAKLVHSQAIQVQ